MRDSRTVSSAERTRNLDAQLLSLLSDHERVLPSVAPATGEALAGCKRRAERQDGLQRGLKVVGGEMAWRGDREPELNRERLAATHPREQRGQGV